LCQNNFAVSRCALGIFPRALSVSIKQMRYKAGSEFTQQILWMITGGRIPRIDA
jgi:hypothetical protein